MLFDMGLDRDEILSDEPGYVFVAVRFGFQPNASPSGGSGAEVEQDWLARLLRLNESCVHIAIPCNSHEEPPSRKCVHTANQFPGFWIMATL
jgi:hypothetical protein